MERTKFEYLLIALMTLAVMTLVYILTEILVERLAAHLTIRYLSWFAIMMIGATVIFREVSIREIESGKLYFFYYYGPESNGFSWSTTMRTTAWWLTLVFLALFILSLFHFFAGWVEKLLGGPIILWLVTLVSFITLASLATLATFFWEKMDQKIHQTKKK